MEQTAGHVKGISCSSPMSLIGETVTALVPDMFLLHFKLLIEELGEKIVMISLVVSSWNCILC
jgi:hypothetical protein